MDLLILHMSKIVMYDYWYDHTKPKYGNKVKLCYANRDSFIVYVKLKDVYADVAGDVEKRFNASNYIGRPLPVRENKKVTELLKDVLDGKIKKEFVVLTHKTCSYLKVLNKTRVYIL